MLIEQKKCSSCCKTKLISLFHKNKNAKYGYNIYCKECRKKNEPYKADRYKIYYEKNREKILEKGKRYIKNNFEKVKKKRKERHYNRIRSDVNYKLTCTLRSRLKDAVKNNFKSGSSVKDLGCSVEVLRLHLESKFKPGMSWENWTVYGWHIDHIIPLSHFDLSDREQLRKACHYTNLQPMWWRENLKKGDRLK